jgi:hypothetical protein
LNKTVNMTECVFGVRRLVTAFIGGTTCCSASPAYSGTTNVLIRTASPSEHEQIVHAVRTFDGDKSPAQSDDKSSHSKAGALIRWCFENF